MTEWTWQRTVSELEHWSIEVIQGEERREKWKKNDRTLVSCETISNSSTYKKLETQKEKRDWGKKKKKKKYFNIYQNFSKFYETNFVAMKC